MKKTIIYFMRHGEVFNPKDILYGRLPRFPITGAGREKAIKTAERMKKEKIDIIYSSPMLRARQTAEIILEATGARIIISNLLTEVRLLMQGMSLKDFRATVQPHIYDPGYVKKGQESVDGIIQRMNKFLIFIIKKHQGQKILVVSHGDPIVIIKAFTTQVPFTYKYKKENYLQTGEWIKLTVTDHKFIWTKLN